MSTKMYLNKKAKSVNVKWKETQYIRRIATYQCPSCKTFHEDGILNENVTRFRCSSCGQEIIIA